MQAKMISDDTAQVEMIQMVMYMFITGAILFTIALVIPPIFTVVTDMGSIMDVTGSIYFDVLSTFSLATKMWFFFLVLVMVKVLIHFGLMAIKKQRYTGVESESDF